MTLRASLSVLVLSVTAVVAVAALPAGASGRAVANPCQSVNVVGWSQARAVSRLRAAHCNVQVRRIGDMGTGPLRVVQQTTVGDAEQRLDLSRWGGRCRFATPYWKVAAKNDVAVVAHTGAEADQLWACIRKTGERRWLGRSVDAYPDWEGFVGMRLAGPWLVYEAAYSGRSSAGGQIVLRDLRQRGGVRRFAGPRDTVVRELAVDARGDTAWSTYGGFSNASGYLPAEVWVRPLGGPSRVVLSGPSGMGSPAPVITALTIDATTVRWEADRVPGSAPTRPAD